MTGPFPRSLSGCVEAILAGGTGLSPFYPASPPLLPPDYILCVVSLLQMKDLGAEHLAGREGVQLLGLLNLYLEQEERFQPREKGLSLIEATPEVSWQKR